MESNVITQLKDQLAKKDDEIRSLKLLLEGRSADDHEGDDPRLSEDISLLPKTATENLTNNDIARYSRQLILPEIGVQGQKKLKRSRVLIVGAGGLGCPAAIYLTAAGIGCLGIVDYDDVEINNLHRQVLHTERKIGTPKTTSVAQSCHRLNSSVHFVPYKLQLTSQNALQIIDGYDIVLDATDNVATRYMLNDACVLAHKPLVSGSALRFEGQLTVYNYRGGPCYRCLYPKPPPPEMVTNCSDGGVLGVVPGIIGCLEALEAIKIIADIGDTYSKRLLLFDGTDTTFRTIKLRPQQHTCAVCGTNPTITELIDYEQFCGARASDKDKAKNILNKEERISVKHYNEMLQTKVEHILIDVRAAVEMDICRLPHPATNIPLDAIGKEKSLEKLKNIIKQEQMGSNYPVVFVCRRGNDSQVAVRTVKESFPGVTFCDIIGGLTAWAKQVDPDFPVY